MASLGSSSHACALNPSLGAVTPITTSRRTPWAEATADARAPPPGTSVGLAAGPRRRRGPPLRESGRGKTDVRVPCCQALAHVTEAPVRPPGGPEIADARRPARHEFRSPRSFSVARNSFDVVAGGCRIDVVGLDKRLEPSRRASWIRRAGARGSLRILEPPDTRCPVRPAPRSRPRYPANRDLALARKVSCASIPFVVMAEAWKTSSSCQ